MSIKRRAIAVAAFAAAAVTGVSLTTFAFAQTTEPTEPSVQGVATEAVAEREAVLTEINKAVRDSPKELGLKVDAKALESYSTKDLKTFRSSLPTDYEFTLDGGEAAGRVSGAQKLSAAAAKATEGCTTANGRVTFIGGVTKAKLWYFQVSVNFCWNNGRRTITSIETARLEGHVYKPGLVLGWHYRGPHQGSPVNTPFKDVFGTARYETYAQASFELCTVKIACPAESNPWVRISTFRDGSFRAEKGGEK